MIYNTKNHVKCIVGGVYPLVKWNVLCDPIFFYWSYIYVYIYIYIYIYIYKYIYVRVCVCVCVGVHMRACVSLWWKKLFQYVFLRFAGSTIQINHDLSGLFIYVEFFLQCYFQEAAFQFISDLLLGIFIHINVFFSFVKSLLQSQVNKFHFNSAFFSICPLFTSIIHFILITLTLLSMMINFTSPLNLWLCVRKIFNILFFDAYTIPYR